MAKGAKGKRNSQKKKKNSKGNDEIGDESVDEGEKKIRYRFLPCRLCFFFRHAYMKEYRIRSKECMWFISLSMRPKVN